MQASLRYVTDYLWANIMKIFKTEITLKNCILAALGSVILAFGLYNVHSFSNVTEGGILGLTLLLGHWLHISPAVSGFVLNAVCYLIGIRILGKKFIAYSIVSGGAFSLFYTIFEQFPPFWSNVSKYPLIAAILGALFVGVGAGLSVRAGGAPCGDDALAMSISKCSKIKIEWVYLFSDLIVLGLSLTYIPVSRIVYSLLTVIISGQLVGLIQRIKLPHK